MIKILGEILLAIIILTAIVIMLGVLVNVTKSFAKNVVLGGNKRRWNIKMPKKSSKVINSTKYEPKHSWKK